MYILPSEAEAYPVNRYEKYNEADTTKDNALARGWHLDRRGIK